MKKNWSEGGNVKYQLIGDNWDKNIIPTYRTSQNKTVSLHLFNMIVVVDRIIPDTSNRIDKVTEMTAVNFIPSIDKQALLTEELTFIIATSVIQNLDQMHDIFEHIYPKHLKHKYSDHAGLKTKQVCLLYYFYTAANCLQTYYGMGMSSSVDSWFPCSNFCCWRPILFIFQHNVT